MVRCTALDLQIKFPSLLWVLMFKICFQDECKRLCQRIKCGLFKRLTVVSMSDIFPPMFHAINCIPCLK